MSAWPPTTHIPEWNSTLQYILITNKDTKPQHRSVSITPVVALHRFQYVDYIHFALCRNGEMRANQHPVRCWHHLALSPPLTSHLCPRLPLTSSRLSEHFIMPCSQRSTSFGLCDPCTVLRFLSFYSYISRCRQAWTETHLMMHEIQKWEKTRYYFSLFHNEQIEFPSLIFCFAWLGVSYFRMKRVPLQRTSRIQETKRCDMRFQGQWLIIFTTLETFRR